MKILLSLLIFCSVSLPSKAQDKPGVKKAGEPSQYLMLSMPTYNDAAVHTVAKTFAPYKGGDKAIGVGMIVSYLSQPSDEIAERLKNFLKMAEQHSLPVVLELEGINYWQAHPELWNWWDKDKPGYDPDNKKNVEWTSWSSDDAVKIGWRNWGSQHRVLPMPNLSSPAYVAACHKELRRLVPIITDWWHALPENKKYLLVAVQIGVELSIGANNWYYPNGNDLLDKPESEDPQYGLNHEIQPSRGAQTIGYAAVKTLGIAQEGKLTEQQIAQAVYKYVYDISKLVSGLGVPRERLFTHAGGWKESEPVYFVGLNEFSCPGWSFYTDAFDPSKDKTAMEAVAKSDAPYWGAVEWLMFDVKEKQRWTDAYQNIFSIPRLRYVQVRHWGSIEKNPQAIEAIREAVQK